MKIIKIFILIIAALILTGCWTTGKNIKTTLNINDNTGIVNVYPDVDTKSGDNSTTSANKTDLKDLVKIPPPLDAAATKLEANIVDRTVEKIVPAVKPENITPQESVKTETDRMDPATWRHFKKFELHEGELYEDGRPFFRLGIPGKQFGKNVLVTGDTDSHSFFIPDTSKDTGDKMQQYYFSGSDRVATFDGNASLFWYRGGSQTVTVHYNGE